MTTSINDYSYRTWENTNTNNVSKSSEESSNVASTATTAAGVANSTVSGIADEAVKDKVTLSTSEKEGYLGKLANLAKEYPKTATALKIFGKVAGAVFNGISGYMEGTEVAQQHSNGDVNHDAQVHDSATAGGVFGSVAGGAAGTAAGAAAGAFLGSVVPVIGTGIGAIVGGIIGGCIGSSVGGSVGAEAGANSVENQYNNELYNEINSHRPYNASIPGFFFSWK